MKKFLLIFMLPLLLIGCNNGTILPSQQTSIHLYSSSSISSIQSSNMYICNIGESSLSSCRSQTGFSPIAISMAQYKNNMVYVLYNDQANHIDLCTVQQNGDIQNCSNQTNVTNVPNPTSMIFFNNYLYIVNSVLSGDINSIITKCSISNINGTLNNCIIESNINGLDGAQDIAILNNYAYISNYNSDESPVIYCAYNYTNGEITNCNNTELLIDSAYGLNINNGKLFITNFTESTNTVINQCNQNINDGTLACKSILDPTMALPKNINLENIQFLNNHVFLASFGLPGVFGFGGGIYQCDYDGTLISNCVNQRYIDIFEILYPIMNFLYIPESD